MAILSVSNLTKSFGPVDIFSGISFTIENTAKIGLVGPNGVGKTTLLRILIGEEFATEGDVHQTRGTRIGYLPQQAKFQSDHTLRETCLAVFSELINTQNQLRELEQQMVVDSSRSGQLVVDYGKLQTEFEFAGGYQYELRIQQTLTGLGFSQVDMDRPIRQLSGGQRTRALLAKLLLEEPDLLLLDEPTNHLDIQAVEWLEIVFKGLERGCVNRLTRSLFFGSGGRKYLGDDTRS